MIIVKIRTWNVINNIEHIATTWQIASDENFTNIIEEIEESTDMLEILFSEVSVPVGETYYVRAKRHFNDIVTSYWVDPIKITNNDEAYDHMLLSEDPWIAQPTPIIDSSAISSTAESITIKSSTFISNIDTHDTTSYFIYDGNDNLLFAKTNCSGEEKESITIENSTNYFNANTLKFGIIHKGATGVESKTGWKILTLNKNLNFEIETQLSSVAALSDLTIQFASLYNTAPNIIKVELRSAGTNTTILELDYNNSDCTVTIPWYYLKEDSKYKLYVKCITTKNEITEVYYTITVTSSETSTIDSSYKYSNKFTYYETEYSEAYQYQYNVGIIPYNIIVEETYNGKILIPNAAHLKCIVYGLNDNDQIENSIYYADGITLYNTDLTGFHLKVLSKQYILIDAYNADGYPTFYLYNYNVLNDAYTLIHSCVREDETYCTGKTGSLVQVNTTEIYYIPPGTTSLKKYDITNNIISSLATIPLTVDEDKGLLLLRLSGGKFLIANGTSSSAVLYTYSNGSITEGYFFYPTSFNGCDLRYAQLKNGSSLVASFEDATSLLHDGDLELVGYTNASMTLLSALFNDYNMQPRSIIRLYDGRVTFTDYNTADSNYEDGKQMFLTYS